MQRSYSTSTRSSRSKVLTTFTLEKRRAQLREAKAALDEETKNPEEKISRITTQFNKIHDGRDMVTQKFMTEP